MIQLKQTTYTGFPRADVEYEIHFIKGKSYILLHDLNKGGRSLTNDAAAVIEDLKRIVAGACDAAIIYRDSTNTYDQIICADDGVKFVCRGALSFKEAIQHIEEKNSLFKTPRGSTTRP